MGGGWARRGPDRDVARTDLRPGRRIGRSIRHGNHRVWPAGLRGRAPRAAGFPDAEGARSCRTTRLRLRSRLPLRLRPRAHKLTARKPMRRIGIDVGGTNTDAVMLEDGGVAHAVKTPTTSDVTTGIVTALAELTRRPEIARGGIDAGGTGTPHSATAGVGRGDRAGVAAGRIGLPASASLPPFCDWPGDLAERVR